jgi:hypothetical protein
MKPNIDGLAKLDRLGKDHGVFTPYSSCEVSPGSRRGAARARAAGIPARCRRAFRYMRESTERYDLKKRRRPGTSARRPTAAIRTATCAHASRSGSRSQHSTNRSGSRTAPPPRSGSALGFRSTPTCRSVRPASWSAPATRCHGDTRRAGEAGGRGCHERARIIAAPESTALSDPHRWEELTNGHSGSVRTRPTPFQQHLRGRVPQQRHVQHEPAPRWGKARAPARRVAAGAAARTRRRSASVPAGCASGGDESRRRGWPSPATPSTVSPLAPPRGRRRSCTGTSPPRPLRGPPPAARRAPGTPSRVVLAPPPSRVVSAVARPAVQPSRSGMVCAHGVPRA